MIPEVLRKNRVMFPFGLRVTLTPQAQRNLKLKQRTGTVVGHGQSEPWIWVVWDGKSPKSREAYHLDFLM